jgi:ATP adenylyltransferase
VKIIWAPWRLDYILGPKDKECIFCTKPRENDDKKNLILYRGRHNFVILNLFPYNNGHLMVVPYKHTNIIEGMDGDEAGEMMRLTQLAVAAVKEVFKPHGFNLGMNLEAAAGAGIDEHIHMHVVPRWNGDTNFMPVVGETRVMPQHIQSTYEALVGRFTFDE